MVGFFLYHLYTRVFLILRLNIFINALRRDLIKYKFILLIIFFTGLIFPRNSRIIGVVTDNKTGSPLIGANVLLEETMQGSATDVDGNYEIKNVPKGNYRLTTTYIGYSNKTQDIEIGNEIEYLINIKLEASSIQLKETKVTAEKRKEKVTEAPASIEIITSRDIKRATTTNMGAYLKGLKGVDFTSSGINNYSISIRGFNSSFSTRLLTLSDGRVGNIPSLRVINYSLVPQSTDDIEKMEVVLGPATALYGANAHSGVINMISKPPALSEGFNFSASGSNDDRQLRKINARWAKKISKNFSFKLSGTYIHAWEWPFISEIEYKQHLYPWSGHPIRVKDGKDNNPWNNPTDPLIIGVNINGDSVLIGNGEPMDTGDPDGDGVMGEDWWNGYDDDGDCPGDTNGDGIVCGTGDQGVDEDYFTANGIDDDNDCTSDSNGDGCYCCAGDLNVDENIDHALDKWLDGYDNDWDGNADDSQEYFSNQAGSDYLPNWQYNLEQENIIIHGGRRDSIINGQLNPWYLPGATLEETNLKGDFYYDENLVEFLFDIYIYDFGNDGQPGDPFEDLAGDGILQIGESTFSIGTFTSFNDYGLDGIPNTNDFGEGDGIWQPGDGWIDSNNNDEIDPPGVDSYSLPDQSIDVYPLANGYWDSNETIFDCGNDGLCPGDPGYTGPDLGENDGKLHPWDSGENDGMFDTGDGIYGYPGDQYDDENNNGVWDHGETYQDNNEDGSYTPPDYVDNFQYVDDINGDGLSDYPDFEVENRRIEFRLDYDPSSDVNLTFQSGYAWTKTQQVTGVSRYLADGFEYTFYQLRGRYKNWYSQYYINQSYSGNTRGYNLGNVIFDQSKNHAYQLQYHNNFNNYDTKYVMGIDYFKTKPFTNGTILNDGPNGYDNDGDNIYIGYNGLDDDNDGTADDNFCSDGSISGLRDGKLWACAEGIDEEDEFVDTESNEYGVYYQTKTELFGTSRYELITAARWDYHDLLEEDIQFAPKLGLIYKPDEKSSLRFTYGKAFNTPNSITLHTDLFIQQIGILDFYLRGNKDGTPYCRVGDECAGGATTATTPGYYTENGTFHSISPLSDDYFNGNETTASYTERVDGAPYFFNLQDNAPVDMLPLDTSRYLVYIPELNGDGVLYNAIDSYNIPDVDPIKTEKIQTVEFGYKGFLWNRTQFTADYYLSYYEDFFSPPTVITPIVVFRQFDGFGNDITSIDNISLAGVMPVNSFGSNPPYGTAWNGIDDDGDFEMWADEFGWWDDLDGNGDPQDAGDWGLVDWHVSEGLDTTGYDIYHPWELVVQIDGGISFKTTNSDGDPIDPTFLEAVGVDEYHATVGLSEAELVPTGLFDNEGNQVLGPGVATTPPHMVLSPMNYGTVWMQGLDLSATQIIPEYNMIIDGNISWYGTTSFYNELTKREDPINAPKFKWNLSAKWDTDYGKFAANFRHVDKFIWKDGIWSGIIGPYNILDIHYNYSITKNVELSISAINLFNDMHKELIGGARMGRQIIMRMSSSF